MLSPELLLLLLLPVVNWERTFRRFRIPFSLLFLKLYPFVTIQQ